MILVPPQQFNFAQITSCGMFVEKILTDEFYIWPIMTLEITTWCTFIIVDIVSFDIVLACKFQNFSQ